MGLLVLHSGHFAKIFTRLMGTTCSLAWRNSADTELVWTVAPAHPIARGVPHPIVIDEQEMYGEYFDIPAPDELVFLSTFSSGEVFRSGCCWRRGKGRVFYFSPGDQEYPVYHHPDIRRVLANAVQWARPDPELGFDPPAVVAMPEPRFPRRPGSRREQAPAARRGGRPRLGRPAAHGRVRRPARCRAGRPGRARDGAGWPAGGPVRDRARAALRRLARPAGSAELDVLSIAAPTTLHAPIAIAALDAGVHVLSEKPLAESAEAGERMVQAAERNQRVLDVSFNHRRRGVVKALKELLDGGHAWARSTTPRPAGSAARASPPWAAGSPGGPRPAAAR